MLHTTGWKSKSLEESWVIQSIGTDIYTSIDKSRWPKYHINHNSNSRVVSIFMKISINKSTINYIRHIQKDETQYNNNWCSCYFPFTFNNCLCEFLRYIFWVVKHPIGKIVNTKYPKQLAITVQGCLIQLHFYTHSHTRTYAQTKMCTH